MQHSLVAAARPVIQPVSGGKLITNQRFGRPQRDLAKTGIARELPPGQKHRVIEQRTPLRRLNPVHETALVNVVKIVEQTAFRQPGGPFHPAERPDHGIGKTLIPGGAAQLKKSVKRLEHRGCVHIIFARMILESEQHPRVRTIGDLIGQQKLRMKYRPFEPLRPPQSFGGRNQCFHCLSGVPDRTE